MINQVMNIRNRTICLDKLNSSTLHSNSEGGVAVQGRVPFLYQDQLEQKIWCHFMCSTSISLTVPGLIVISINEFPSITVTIVP